MEEHRSVPVDYNVVRSVLFRLVVGSGEPSSRLFKTSYHVTFMKKGRLILVILLILVTLYAIILQILLIDLIKHTQEKSFQQEHFQPIIKQNEPLWNTSEEDELWLLEQNDFGPV